MLHLSHLITSLLKLRQNIILPHKESSTAVIVQGSITSNITKDYKCTFTAAFRMNSLADSVHIAGTVNTNII